MMPFRCPICKRIAFSSQNINVMIKGYDIPFLTSKVCLKEQCLIEAYDRAKRLYEIVFPSEESE